MALYMWMARYTPEAARAIIESGSNREEVARAAVEAGGGKLLGFYGLIGQDYHVALICDMPGTAEFLGVAMVANFSGAIAAYKTIPMYDMAVMQKAREVSKKVSAVYKPPAG